MDLKELETLDNLDLNTHWYYQSKANAMKKIIKDISPKKIIDVGAGSGFFAKYLLKNTAVKEAYCIDINYKNNKFNFIGNKKIFYKKKMTKNNFDLLLLMDVIEHVDDDYKFLNDCLKKIDFNSYILITVPAFNLLYSDHDIFLGHKRRYNLTEIELLLKKFDLKIIKKAYFFGFLFPIVALNRLIGKFINIGSSNPRSQMRSYNYLLNILFAFVCKIELIFFTYNKYFGLSVFCLAQKVKK